MSRRPARRVPIGLVAAVFGGMLVVMCAGCAGLVFVFRPVSEPVTAADRAVLLTVEDVQPYLKAVADPAMATLDRTRQPGRVTIKYTYEASGVLVQTELSSSRQSRQEMQGFTPVFLNLVAGEEVRFSEPENPGSIE